MGFDILRFVTDVDEELMCSICKGVLEDPLMVRECQHLFCKMAHDLDDLDQSEDEDESDPTNEWICPMERRHVKNGELGQSPRIVENMLNKLKIKCEFVSNGCLQIISLESLPQHISQCHYNPTNRIVCKSGCGQVVHKPDLDSHDCVDVLLKKLKDMTENMKCLRNENKILNELVENCVNFEELKKFSQMKIKKENDD